MYGVPIKFIRECGGNMS